MEQTQHELDVQRMEQEELALIHRLKNTKLQEENAHKELENALTEDPALHFQNVQAGRGRGKNSRGGRRV